MTLPDSYTLSARISGDGDDWTDIEIRSATEKYTVGTVEDRFASLFLAAPDMLTALENMVDGEKCFCREIRRQNPHTPGDIRCAVCKARDAIAKAKGGAS